MYVWDSHILCDSRNMYLCIRSDFQKQCGNVGSMPRGVFNTCIVLHKAAAIQYPRSSYCTLDEVMFCVDACIKNGNLQSSAVMALKLSISIYIKAEAGRVYSGESSLHSTGEPSKEPASGNAIGPGLEREAQLTGAGDTIGGRSRVETGVAGSD
jgi:hypothetical protein